VAEAVSTGWGVLHPDGRVSVQIDGHPFGSREEAEAEARKCDAGDKWLGYPPGARSAITGLTLGADGFCDFCGEDTGKRPHGIMRREVGPWIVVADAG
jgi:hypothetical protein